MIKHKETQPDLVQSLIDLVNQYNYTRELTATLMRNSNEIDGVWGRNSGVGGQRERVTQIIKQKPKPLWRIRREFYLGSKNFSEKISNYLKT